MGCPPVGVKRGLSCGRLRCDSPLGCKRCVMPHLSLSLSRAGFKALTALSPLSLWGLLAARTGGPTIGAMTEHYMIATIAIK